MKSSTTILQNKKLTLVLFTFTTLNILIVPSLVLIIRATIDIGIGFHNTVLLWSGINTLVFVGCTLWSWRCVLKGMNVKGVLWVLVPLAMGFLQWPMLHVILRI